MNGVDVVIIFILIFGALSGMRRGFIVMVASILGALLAFAVARVEYAPVRSFLASFAPHSPWLTIISYLIVFLVVWGLVLAAARMARRTAHMFMLGPLDRLGGFIIGALQSAIVLDLLLYLAKHASSKALASAIKHSTLAPTFLQLVPALHRLFPHIPQ